MSDFLPAPDLFPSTELLPALLDVSLTGIVLFTPIYAPAGAAEGEVVDFAFAYLNPAAQQMLKLPPRPTVTYFQQFAQAATSENGGFAFQRKVFVTGEPAFFELNYQADGYDNYFRAAARRVGVGLLVSFTDTADQPRTAVELALRESQTREKAARAEAEAQRQQLHDLVMHAPACIATLAGPEHTFTLVNPFYQRLSGGRRLVGLPCRVALPEVAGQPFFDLLDEVYRTGETYQGHEVFALVDHTGAGQLEPAYFNFIYQATRDATGTITGILIFAYDVTPQVLARHRIEESEQVLTATNDELHATNDELYRAEHQLRELNQQLEAQVQRRTEQLQDALRQTDHHRQQLQLQQRQLQQILGEVPAYIATLAEPNHRFTFFNAGYNALVGGRAQLGRPVAEVLPETVEQGFVALLDQVYATGEAFSAVEAPIELRNSATGLPEQRYLDFIYQPLHDGHGRTQGILAFVVDTTEKVRIRQQAAVQQRQLEVLFEQAPVGIAVFRGPRYVVESANVHLCDIWGRTPAQVLDRPLFEALPEASDQGFEELLDGVLTTGTPYVAHELPVLLDRHGRRETVYFSFVYQPLREADGPITGVTVVATDVTESMQARQQLEALSRQLAAANQTLQTTNADLALTNDQLTRANVDLDTFIYTASHDLRAPIVNIEGLLTALEQELPAPTRQAAAVAPLLTMMHDAVARFLKTLDHLTDVTKLQKTHDQPTTHVNLAAIVEEVRLDLAAQIVNADAALIIDVADCPSIPFAAKHLRSVVYNLLSNALKYRDPARPLRVELRCRRAAEYVVLTVQDNGLGLSPNRQTELFTMFKRFHTHVAGSGVGLYMVKKIVENGGGRVEVDSAAGVGSTFRVFLRP